MGPSPAVVVAGATGLPDALVAGGPAGVLDRPILLVTRTGVPEVTAAALRDLGATSSTVVGGTGVVADSVLTALPGARRVSGADRYATAAAVAAAFDDLVPAASVVVGSGADASLVDALPGGALGRIMLLTPTAALASAASAYVGSAPVTSAVVLGGPGAVSDGTLVSLSRVVG
jgi:putative cell wall-binding protein